ncbi:MAG: hypothetical protein FWF36_08855 [Propionibacteriaceae bacterium]|nr:hypothetical protein [Propionibacteriaceae bacterium]
MVLYVDPPIVKDCVTRLQGSADAIGSADTARAKCASRYLTDNVRIPLDDSVGLYPDFRDNVAKIPMVLGPKFETLHFYLFAASASVGAFMTTVEAEDTQRAQDLDQQVVNRYGNPGLPSLPDTSASPGVWNDPAETLTDPSGQSPNDLFFELVSILGIGDLASGIGSAAMSLPGISGLVDKLKYTWGGNWNDAYRCSDALEKLSKFATALGDEMNDTRLTVSHGWTGNSADTFNDWMLRTTDWANRFAEPLKDASTDTANVAAGMQAWANTAETILVTIAGLIIAALIELAAAPETLGGSLAAEVITVAAIAACIAEVSSICTAAALVVEDFSVFVGQLSDAALTDGVSVPGPYTGPLEFW